MSEPNWDGEERRRQSRDLHDVASLAVSVGYLRRSVDELSERFTQKIHAKTRLFRTISIALALAFLCNAGALYYIVQAEEQRRIDLAAAVVASCEQRKQLESSIIAALRGLQVQTDDESDDRFGLRVDALDRLIEQIDSPTCAELLAPVQSPTISPS